MIDREQEHVSDKYIEEQAGSVIVMVPFDGNFNGHGLTPQDVFSGSQSAAGSPFGDEGSPPSFSYSQFGFHPENSLIHVIDLRKCTIYSASDDRDYYTFRSKELTEDEKDLPTREADKRLLLRCIKLVAVSNPHAVQYEPDSIIHDVLVRTNAYGLVEEIPRGEIVYRSALPPAAQRRLADTHKLDYVPAGDMDPDPGISPGSRKARFSRLAKGMEGNNILDNLMPVFYTNPKASAVNVGQARIVSDDYHVRLNHLGPGNPGFAFSHLDSYLRTGQQLTVETDLPEVKWGPYMARLNPLAYYLPPNLVNYYPLFLFSSIEELEVIRESLGDLF